MYGDGDRSNVLFQLLYVYAFVHECEKIFYTDI